MFELSVYVTQGMHGVVSGMLLFLVASGLTLVFGMLGILNIAHAGFYMLGAYLAYSTVHATGHFWLSLLVAPLVVGALGALVERFFDDPVQGLSLHGRRRRGLDPLPRPAGRPVWHGR